MLENYVGRSGLGTVWNGKEDRIQNSEFRETNGEPARGSPWSLLNSEFCILNSVLFAVSQSGMDTAGTPANPS